MQPRPNRRLTRALALALGALSLLIPAGAAGSTTLPTLAPRFSGAVVSSFDNGARKDVGARGVDAMPMRPDLSVALAEAGAGERMVVLVSGHRTSAVRRATVAADLDVVEVFRRVGVVVAVGTPAEIRSLHAHRGIAGIYPPMLIQPASDSALVVTGVEALRSDQRLRTLRRSDGTAYDGSGVTIAVIDSGIDAAHEMFVENGESKVDVQLRQHCETILEDEELGPPLCTGWLPGEGDEHGVAHGTHVASIAAGYERTTPGGRTVSGVATGARLVELGVGDPAGALANTVGLNLVSALNWVLEHHEDPCGDGSCPPIRVLNLSWGGGFGEPYDPDEPLNKLSSALAQAGVVVVWSAGNFSSPSAVDDGSENTMSMLALNPTPGVISVANYYDGEIGDRELGVHWSSRRGKDGEPETYPDVAAPGTWVMAACPMLSWCPAIGGPGNLEGDYAFLSGTSMSAPHVAGLAAVLLEANPALSPGDVEDILEDSAYKFGEPSEYVADPYNADDTTSYRAGHGLVDAVGAVSLALERGARRAPGPCPHIVGNSVSFADQQDNLQVAPHYDITRVKASWPVPGDVVNVDIHVADLQPIPLAGPNDIYNLEFQVDGEHLELFYMPLTAAPSTAMWSGDATADAVYDPDRDIISFSIRLGESFDQKRRLGGLGAWTSTNNGTAGLVDFAYGTCTIWRSPGGAASNRVPK